jgi:hypothetical protein
MGVGLEADRADMVPKAASYGRIGGGWREALASDSPDHFGVFNRAMRPIQ